MEKREHFSSRLGFILISAGCAIGLGNVWRFPYIVGQYGGAAFVLIYILFLVILGMPIMAMEFAVGRASQKSAARSFHVLEPKGTKWHIAGWSAMAGNYILMMFYTTVGGWMLAYIYKTITGEFEGLDAEGVGIRFTTADETAEAAASAIRSGTEPMRDAAQQAFLNQFCASAAVRTCTDVLQPFLP